MSLAAIVVLVGVLTQIHGLEIGGVEVGRGRLIGKVISSILNPKGGEPVENVTTPEPPVKEDEIPLWRQLIDTVKAETDDLDDVIFSDEAEEEEDFGELEERLGLPVPDIVDCYGLPEPVSSVLRFIFKTDDTVHAKFFLSTRNHPEQFPVPKDLNGTGIDFDPQRRTIFIIHGFMSDGQTQWVKNMTEAFLSKVDANVFAVDWSEGGSSWMYWKAVANTRVAGAEVAEFILKLKDQGLKTRNIHLVGHSLGAHICSYVASRLGGVSRITGLDPAQPCFQDNSPEIRLDPSDADFIDVIHTNGRVLEKLGLGLPQPIGHVDFYPNGGAKQPGCSKKSKSILFPLFNAIKNRIEKSICSHGRSYMFFTESIKASDECSFWGHRWSRNDTEADEALLSPCNAANCTEMGIEADVFPARGSFFVPTRARKPYCIYDPKTDEEMLASLARLYRRKKRSVKERVYNFMKSPGLFTFAQLFFTVSDPRTDGEMVRSLSRLYRRVERIHRE